MSLRSDALALYKPPFQVQYGYIFDSLGRMVADDGNIDEQQLPLIVSRVRGWGRIGYLPNPQQLQDEVGRIMVEALNDYWEKHSNLINPVVGSKP